MTRWGIVTLCLPACALVVDLDPLRGTAGDGGRRRRHGGVLVDGALDAGAYIAEVGADSPSSWWRLGESNAILPAVDENGDFAPGAYRDAGVTLGVKGALSKDGNTAAMLDGVSGAVVFSGSIFDLEGLGAFSIELWTSPAGATGQSQSLVEHRTAAPSDGWGLFLDGSLVPTFVRVKSGTVVGGVTGSKALPTGKYTHLVVTGDGSTMLLYVDGQLDASGPTQGSITSTSAPHLVLGASSDLTQAYFAGLDEVAIYAQALTPQRVLAHYVAGTQ